jgi:hypothetical protein
MEGRADPDFTAYRIAIACKSGSKTVATHRSNASYSHSQPHNSHGIDAILEIKTNIKVATMESGKSHYQLQDLYTTRRLLFSKC